MGDQDKRTYVTLSTSQRYKSSWNMVSEGLKCTSRAILVGTAVVAVKIRVYGSNDSSNGTLTKWIKCSSPVLSEHSKIMKLWIVVAGAWRMEC